MGFLNSASSSMALTRPTADGSAHRTQDDDVLRPRGRPGSVPARVRAARRPSPAHRPAPPRATSCTEASFTDPTPNGSENRTSPSTMSRISGIPLRNCRVRSRPMPNAKPEYTSGSMPAARNTFGLTMPQPPHSTQPGPPFLFSNHTSTSADGSVNGKKCGRIRVRACGPNSERANASRVPRRLRHRQPAIDREALHLMEHRGVGGVQFVGAEGAADRDDVHRQVAVQQRAHLHRRGVRAQQLTGSLRGDVEGVGLAAGRVVWREVQRIEVELLALHLRPLGQLPAHRDEGVGDVLGQDGDRVARTERLAGRRQGDVDGLGHQNGRVALGAQRRQPLVVVGLRGRRGPR